MIARMVGVQQQCRGMMITALSRRSFTASARAQAGSPRRECAKAFRRERTSRRSQPKIRDSSRGRGNPWGINSCSARMTFCPYLAHTPSARSACDSRGDDKVSSARSRPLSAFERHPASLTPAQRGCSCAGEYLEVSVARAAWSKICAVTMSLSATVLRERWSRSMPARYGSPVRRRRCGGDRSSRSRARRA